jgi:hypothetical protein
MIRVLLLATAALGPVAGAIAQNGKLVEDVVIQFSDAALTQIETNFPGTFRLVCFEGGDHLLTEHNDEVSRLAKDWLDRYVRDRKPWPSLKPHGR